MRLVFAGCAVIAVSVLVGWLATPLVGVALLVVALVVGAVAYLRAPNPEHRTPFADAENEPHPHGGAPGKRHVVVVANQALAGDELRHRLIEMGARLELDVLAPVLTSHLHYAVSDIDAELAEARNRLDRSLAWAQQSGFVARGEVGDPNPTTAIEDELRDFGADAVVVVTHPRELETWQERGELERLRRELHVPVEHVTVGAGTGED
ncbi:MAG TPA: universal stress protein [Solirubrobacteraceae bacterium]|nr:universal stress protein [Solirubrobacteraceae bacterium]